MVSFNRRFGVEIEATNIERYAVAELLRAVNLEADSSSYTHRVTPYWKVVSDGSLHGDKPFELVSPILQGESGLLELKKACTALEAGQAKINKSCGLHIHFDAQGWQQPQFKVLLRNYANLEPLIDLLMPKSRRARNNARFLDSLIGKSYQEAVSSRYFKVNFQSFARHGTVEFRQHSGTVEFPKMAHWIMVCHKVMSLTEANVRVPNNLNIFELAKWFFFTRIDSNGVQPVEPTSLNDLKAEVYQLLGIDPANRWATMQVRSYLESANVTLTASLLSSAGWREVLDHLRTANPNIGDRNATLRLRSDLNLRYWLDRMIALDASINDPNARAVIDYLESLTYEVMAA